MIHEKVQRDTLFQIISTIMKKVQRDDIIPRHPFLLILVFRSGWLVVTARLELSVGDAEDWEDNLRSEPTHSSSSTTRQSKQTQPAPCIQPCPKPPLPRHHP